MAFLMIPMGCVKIRGHVRAAECPVFRTKSGISDAVRCTGQDAPVAIMRCERPAINAAVRPAAVETISRGPFE